MSYNPDAISYESDASDDHKRNAVRFLIDDKNVEEERYTDSELNTWIATWTSVWQAAAELADKEIGAGIIEEDIGSAARIRYLRMMAPTWRSRASSHQVPICKNIDQSRVEFDGVIRF